MIDPKLDGRTALITGCNNPHGTGAAIALALAAQGVRICAHYFRPNTLQVQPESASGSMGEQFYLEQQEATADWLMARTHALGGQANAIEADLADPDSVLQLFDKAEELGNVDILVNNAAYCLQDSFLSTAEGDRAVDGFPMQTLSVDSFDRHFAVNTRATALLMTEFARRHSARGLAWGRIVNVSTDGAASFPTEVSYGASKYAIESLSRSAAAELGSLGITINVVSLGPIQTGWITPELEIAISRSTPLGRIGQPDDVADVVVFLASQQARWITGQIVRADGGHYLG